MICHIIYNIHNTSSFRFEQNIAINNKKVNVDNDNSYNKIKCQNSNFQQSSLDIALYKEMNSSLQKKYTSTVVSK